MDPVCYLLGSTCTKVSEVLENQDRAIFDAIQAGIDKANQGAASNAQKVSRTIIIIITLEPLSKGQFGTSHFVPCREAVLFSEVSNIILHMGI